MMGGGVPAPSWVIDWGMHSGTMNDAFSWSLPRCNAHLSHPELVCHLGFFVILSVSEG